MIRIVKNHWGWDLAGIRNWFRYGWAKPIAIWGCEVTDSRPRQFDRRIKIGPFCFSGGRYVAKCGRAIKRDVFCVALDGHLGPCVARLVTEHSSQGEGERK